MFFQINGPRGNPAEKIQKLEQHQDDCGAEFNGFRSKNIGVLN
jgi:hypothetical protein